MQETLSVEIAAEYFLDDNYLLCHHSVTIGFQFDVMGILKNIKQNDVGIMACTTYLFVKGCPQRSGA